MLTKKQSELLRFIQERLRETGVPPSFDEMKDAMDLASKSGIHRLVLSLEERGFIRRLPYRARAIEILKSPNFSMPDPAHPAHPAIQAADHHRGPAPSVVDIPVMGRIAAGTPIAALQGRSGTIGLPPDMLPSGEVYALEVRGDSMIEAGIFGGDTVVIRRQDHGENGDIVVALIDGEEATLKRLRKRGTTIALEAANPAYETRLFGPDRVSIQGKLVSLVRRY